MPQPRCPSSLVVGAGFVGLATALRLVQATGGKVTMLEAAQGGPGTVAAASFGNAGTFAPYANVPVARPGLWREAARMLVAPGSFKTPPPLSMLANGHAPALVPWLARLVRNCAPNRVRATALALGALLARAERAYDAVFEAAHVDVDADMGEFASDGGAGLPFALRNGYLLLHNSAKSLEGSSRAASLRREGLGPELRMERVDASGVLDLEPGIAPSFVGEGGAWYFPDAWCLREPAALLRALAHGFLNAGGEVRSNAPVEAVGTHKDGRGWVRLKGGESISADVIVVAAGAHSAALAATTGDAIPLDTERGHSVTFAPGSEHAISRAVCTADGGFILTPMVGGLRAAGLVELGGLRAPLTRSVRTARKCVAHDAPRRHRRPRRVARLAWLPPDVA